MNAVVWKIIISLFVATIFIPGFIKGATTSFVITQNKSASLALSPQTALLAAGDIFLAAITLDTKGNAVDGVDIFYLNYNPSLLEVQDDDSVMSGTQIDQGSLMPNTLLNSVDASSGKISFSQVADASSSYVGVGTLATVRFKALAAGTASVTFDFVSGNTADTNAASDGVDILTAVTNGTYTITGQTQPGQDTSAPSVPSNLSATVISSSQIGLTWSASSDNVAVVGYRVYRNGVQITTVGSVSFSDPGLLASTSYTYAVSAYDTAGNVSGQSLSVSATTGGTSGDGGGGGGNSYVAPLTLTQPTTINTTEIVQTPLSPNLPSGIPEGSLVRGPDGIKVWIVNWHGYKRHIFNPAVFNMYGHFKWDQIKTLDQSTLDSIKTSDFYRADGDTRVFSLKEIDERQGFAQKRWMNISGDKFTQLGYKWEQVFIINTKERDYYQEGTPLSEQELAGNAQPTTITTQPVQPATIKIFSGMLVKSQDSPIVYYITPALLKKPIPSIEVFNSYNNQWSNVKAISKQQLDSILLVSAIRLVGGVKVYILENNTKRWVKTQDAFYRLGLDWNKIAQVNQTEFNYYSEGSSVE